MSNLYAALDLGSNSFHLLIGEINNGQIRVVERFSEKVQLGAGLLVDGKINNAAMVRGLSCLKGFQAHIKRYPSCQIKCCGTQAMRKAKNSRKFLKTAADYGFDIEVIDGIQEAEWVYQGVISNLPTSDKTRLVIDVGGGSTEFALGRGDQLLDVDSIPMGCVSWRELYFSNGLILDEAWAEATLKVRELMVPIVKGARFNADEVYVSSGTARMLNSICHENNIIGDDGEIQIKSLKKLQKILWAYHQVDDVILAGLKPQRRDLLLSGLNIMLVIAQQLKIQQLTFSKTALREGMLLSMVDTTD